MNKSKDVEIKTMDPYDSTLQDVLASKEFLMKHPGASQLGSDIYSSATNAISEIVERQRYSGQYISNANQLSFGSQSTFFLSPGSVMNQLILSCSVNLPQYTRAPDFWFLNAIDSVELVVSGSSSVQSLKINGRSHMDTVMATLDSKKLEVLRQTNKFINLQAPGTFTINGSIPLHLFFSSAEMKALFPIDTSTLQSQLIVNVRWKPSYQVFSGDATNAVVLPSSFSSLYLRVGSQVTINSNFAIANSLKNDPELVYSIPGTYLQSYTQIVDYSGSGIESLVNLTSMPSGNLQCILASLSYLPREGQQDTQGLISPWCDFGSVRVLYNGIELYRADSQQELVLMNSLMTNRDSGININWRTHLTANAVTPVVQYQATPVLIIPMANEISEVLRDRRHENTKDYSGSSIQFFFTPSTGTPYSTDSTPVTANTVDDNPIGQYRVNFTFVNAALYEISQRSVSMEM